VDAGEVAVAVGRLDGTLPAAGAQPARSTTIQTTP
jgi:hypothetical protein